MQQQEQQRIPNVRSDEGKVSQTIPLSLFPIDLQLNEKTTKSYA